MDFSDSKVYADEYEKLLRAIYKKPLQTRPALGVMPSYLEEVPGSSTKPAIEKANIQRSRVAGAVNLDLQKRSFFKSTIAALHDLRIDADPEGELDDLIVQRINSTKSLRNHVVDVFLEICDDGLADTAKEIVFGFFEQIATLQNRPPEMNSWNQLWFDHYKFIARELFVYWIAVLLKRKQFAIAKEFINEQYCYRDGDRRQVDGCEVFNKYISSLEEYRKQRLKLNRISLTADLFKERADHPSVDFDDVMEADLIILMVPVLTGSNTHWFPRTLVYCTRFPEPTSIFMRTHSPKGLVALEQLFGLANRDELIAAFKANSERCGLDRYRFDHHTIPFSSLLNINGK